MSLGSLDVIVEKSPSWVNVVSILKEGRRKGRELPTYIQTGKFFSVLQEVFISQAVPVAVTALQCCFQHIWFVHAAIQGVTAAQLNQTSLPPRHYIQLKVSWWSTIAMKTMYTQGYIHNPQGNYNPGAEIGWGAEPC